MVIVIAPTLPLAISPEGQHFLQMCREILRGWMDRKPVFYPLGWRLLLGMLGRQFVNRCQPLFYRLNNHGLIVYPKMRRVFFRRQSTYTLHKARLILLFATLMAGLFSLSFLCMSNKCRYYLEHIYIYIGERFGSYLC